MFNRRAVRRTPPPVPSSSRKGSRKGLRKGFTLVELLGVVLIMAVLSAAAVPVYTGMTKSSAARVCRASLNRVARAQSAYYARFGVFCFDGGPNGKAKGKKKGNTTAYAVVEDYVAPASSGAYPTGGLIGAPAGLIADIHCPLDGSTYTCRRNGTNSEGVDIQCPNAASHTTYGGSNANSPAPWQLSLIPGQDNLP